MRMSRALACLAGLFAAGVAIFPSPAETATLSVVGATTKICQLIGDTDWASGQPTAARTLTNFGLDAVDLGFPVESGRELYFLFGDAVPNGHAPGSIPTVPPDDALGFTSRRATPDPAACLDLQLAVSAPQTFAHPTVHPPIQQGSFNVPSGGIFLDDRPYGFFWTDHCLAPGFLLPDPAAPLTFPAPNPFCPQVPLSNSIGRSVLAWATAQNPVDFHRAIAKPSELPRPFLDMPSGFVYVTATNPPPEIAPRPELLHRPGIPVFGTARYRASIPYLAIAPRETFADPATWVFFAGRVGNNPIFIDRAQWESGRNSSGQWVPPGGAEIYQPPPVGQRCVGEHSVTWNAPLHVWLLLYNCVSRIEARFAPEPWGPWSLPIVLLDSLNPTFSCTLLQSASGCTGLRNYQTFPDGSIFPGFFYAPFVMNRFTRDATPPGAGQPKQATIYWLVSTWNPYVVVMMQTTLQLTP